jgi:serine phosphatase RsbU (regulator of sigma subunit)
VALSALRAARVDGEGLHAMARAVDQAFADQFTDSRFSTAVLMRLNLVSGELRYVNAGHPAPVVMRAGKAVGRLDAGRRLPLGLDDAKVEIGEARLEHGDRLLCFTDGVTEARDRAGELFGEDRLVDLAERYAAGGLPAPETLRRLAQAVAAHLDGPPVDDATVLLIEWSREAADRIMP